MSAAPQTQALPPGLTSMVPAASFLPARSFRPQLWSSAPRGYPLTCSPTPALQVPGEQVEEAQGPLRAEEPDSQA